MEPIYLLPAFFLAVGGICLFAALWSRNPKHIGTAVGKLQNAKRVMVWSRRARKKLPVTNFVYLYEVNGKTYRLKRDTRSSRNRLMQRVTVVYLKAFPRFGFLEKFPFWLFTLAGILSIAYSAWMLVELQ